MDDIQRKLALIDQQLAGQRNLHKQIVSTSPLAFIAVGLITGILLQNKFELSLGLWLKLLVLFATGTLVFFALQRFSFNNQSSIINYQFIIAYLACFCFICLGAIRLSSFYNPRPNNIRNFVTNERELATIRGLIVTNPYINQNQQWKFAKFTYTDPTSSFYIKIKEIKTIDGWAKATGIVRVQVDQPVLDLKAGDYIQAYCWLEKFRPVTNPGQFDIAKYLARRNVFIAASVKSRNSIELLENRGTGYLTKVREKLRETATQALLGDPLPEESPSQGLLQALLLGYRRDIDNTTYEAFRKTGLLHFISLSGLHLGILAWIICWLCKRAGLMKPVRAVICIIAIGVYLLIVPPRAPTLRAAIMCWVLCASFFFRRHSDPLNMLSLAAIILLLIRPTELFEPGWQLSFASVLGIILFADRIYFLVYERITNTSWFKKGPKSELFSHKIREPRHYILGMFSVGLSAWLGGAGVLLYHFYTINPLTSIWTVVVFPLVAGILAIGYLKIILSFLLPSVASVLGVPVNFLSDLMIWIVQYIASLHIAGWNISEIHIGKVSLVVVILYYAFVLFVFFAYFRRPLLKKAMCTGMALAIIVFLGVTKWQRINRDNLVLTCLDVGHGQAILAQLPGKANVWFDAGSLHKSDIGRRIVAPFLDYSGISKSDAIIISHNDVDHINAIPEIVEHCDVNGVYANEAFFTAVETDPCDTAAFLDNVLRKKEKDFEIKKIKDLNLNSAAKIKILWPNEQIRQDKGLSDNDKSVVSLIEFAGRKVLLCSDIEKFAQQELLRLFPDLKAEIMVVPHHGLISSLEPDFLESLDADILICSCDQSQYERTNPTPHPLTHDSKTKSFYTARNGAITVCINKHGNIEVTTFAENE